MADIEISIGADDKELKKSFDNAEKGAVKSGSKISSTLSSSFKKVGVIAGAVLAGASVVAVTRLISDSIRLASAQEDAVNSLNASLRATGSFSESASKDFQNFASELQKVTTIGDEATLELLAFAKTLGSSNEQAKELVKTSADVASGLGVDAKTAIQALNQTLEGQVGTLGRLVPSLKNLTEEQLRAGDGIRLVQQLTGGRALADTQTYSGAVTQLGNAWGDLQESIGSFFTQSVSLRAIVKAVTESISFFGDEIKNSGFSLDGFFNFAIGGFLSVGQFIETYFLPVIKNIGRVFSIIKDGIISGFATIGLAIGGVVELAGNALGGLSGFLGLDSLSQTLESATTAVSEFNSSLTATIAESGASIAETFNNALVDQDTGQGIFEKLSEDYTSFSEQLAEQEVSPFKSIGDSALEAGNAVAQGLDVAGKASDKLAKTTAKTAKTVSFDFQSRIANGISGAVQNFAQSLASGENIFSNFGKFLFGAIGDFATQLGTFFISSGIAIEALEKSSGTGSIAAGIALVAFGSLVKSLFGGGGSPAGATVAPSDNIGATQTGGGVINTGGEVADSVQDEEEERQIGQSVNVTVQGNVFDIEESGESIAEAINRAFETRGSTINSRVLA